MANVDIFIRAQNQTNSAFRQIDSNLSRLGRNVQSLNQSGINPLQAGLTGLATAGFDRGFTAIGTAAKGTVAAVGNLISENNALNEGLANVQSLGVSQSAIAGYRDEIQSLSLAVGKDGGDLTDGLYQVISAFGETSESQRILEINAKAAAAGIATTGEAIALTSAVSKGYDDVTAAAIQKTADLAFQTVKLGQTTFPELARSMGEVIPLAAALGVEQETVFAQYATLTGVTGSTSQVGTQLKNAYQQMLRPTTEMAEALSTVAVTLDKQGELVDNDFTRAWQDARDRVFATSSEMMNLQRSMESLSNAGEENSDEFGNLEDQYKSLEKTQKKQIEVVDDYAASLGKSIVESVGANNALLMLTDSAKGNTNTLGKMFGSVEALNAVLALSGAQADDFTFKYGELQDVVGAADAAFEAQTNGINKSGFALKQLAQASNVLKQDAGEAFGGLFAPLLEDAAELATIAVPNMTTALKEAAPEIQSALANLFTGGESFDLGDIIKFDLDDSIRSTVSVGDFFSFEKLTINDFVDGEQIKVDLSGVFSFTKLSFDDIVETNFDFLSPGSGFTFTKIKAEDLIETNFDLGKGVFTFTKIKAEDFIETGFNFAGIFSYETKVDLSQVIKRVGIGEIFDFEQGFDIVGDGGFTKWNFFDLISFDSQNFLGGEFTKFAIGDFIDFSSGLLPDGQFQKLSVGDLISVDFVEDFGAQLATGKLSFGDLISIDFASDMMSEITMQKLSIKDIFDVNISNDFKKSLTNIKLKFGDLLDLEFGFDFNNLAFTKIKIGNFIDISDFSLSSLLGMGDASTPSGPFDSFGVSGGMSQEIDINGLDSISQLIGWKFPDPPGSFLGWEFPDAPGTFTGWKFPDPPGAFTGWKWPTLPSFPKIEVSIPSALRRFLGGGDSGEPEAGNALGGPVRRSGLSRFNEFGQEAVMHRVGGMSFPRGSMTYLNRGDHVVPANQLAGAMGGGGQPITVNIYNPVMNSGANVRAISRQVGNEIRRNLP